MSDYNGWTNRVTWLVNVWFSPTTAEDLDSVQEALEEKLDELKADESELSKCIGDMCGLPDVNWHELRDRVVEEQEA